MEGRGGRKDEGKNEGREMKVKEKDGDRKETSKKISKIKRSECVDL